MALLPPPPLPLLGPFRPLAQNAYFSEMNVKQLANCIYSTKLKVRELYEYLQMNEELLGAPMTPIPDKYVGLPDEKPFPEETTPHPPPIRAYRVDGTWEREIWNTLREIGGTDGNNRGYVDILEGGAGVPSLYWLLDEKLKTEAIDRRTPALLARLRWRQENL